MSNLLLCKRILATLAKEPHCTQLVKIKARSTSKDLTAADAMDIGNDEVFISTDKPDQWLRYEFQDYARIRPIGYLFECAACDCAKELVIEGSVDRKAWPELSHWENASTGVAKAITRTTCSDCIQMVRVRQVGMNFSGNHRLAIRSFDIFGYEICDVTAKRKGKLKLAHIAEAFPDADRGEAEPLR
jgi:hypothetical protein